MALATREEITAVWRALSGGGQGDGWRSIAISGLSGSRLMAARHFPSNDEALLVGFSDINLPQKNQLPKASGFRVEQAVLDSPGKWLALVRQSQGSLDLFSRMVADIVATLSEHADRDDQYLFQLFLGRIRGWQQFMKKGGEGLGPEAELGLVGELQCMDILLEAGVPAHLVVEGWLGPIDGLQDFKLGNGAVEVKSTLATEGFPASILSLEQLDDAVCQPLFLCGCRFVAGMDGSNLPERVAAMREKLIVNDSALALFRNAMLHSGYDDEHAGLYTRCFVMSDCTFHLVDKVFPRLTPGTVPLGVRQARYEIDLGTVPGKTFSANEVIEMIGIV